MEPRAGPSNRPDEESKGIPPSPLRLVFMILKDFFSSIFKFQRVLFSSGKILTFFI